MHSPLVKVAECTSSEENDCENKPMSVPTYVLRAIVNLELQYPLSPNISPLVPCKHVLSHTDFITNPRDDKKLNY